VRRGRVIDAVADAVWRRALESSDRERSAEASLMSRRLTHQESREIKRAMRATPGISHRMNYGCVDDEGRFMIQAGGPIDGQLLEASKPDDGTWTIKFVGYWMT